MVRDKGMQISLLYANDGHWRVKSNSADLDHSGCCEDEGFARTELANLTRPYGTNCAWKVKFNVLSELGMEPAPAVRVVALDEGETTFRKVYIYTTPSGILMLHGRVVGTL